MQHMCFEDPDKMVELMEDEMESDYDSEDQEILKLQQLEAERKKQKFLKNLPFKTINKAGTASHVRVQPRQLASSSSVKIIALPGLN